MKVEITLGDILITYGRREGKCMICCRRDVVLEISRLGTYGTLIEVCIRCAGKLGQILTKLSEIEQIKENRGNRPNI